MIFKNNRSEEHTSELQSQSNLVCRLLLEKTNFIDLHVHGALGRDSMETSVEAFQAISNYHASGGTTWLLLTTATAPLDRITDVLNVVRDCIPRLAPRASPTISPIAGVHVEGPFISNAKCGAQQAEIIQNPSRPSVQQLLD